VGRGVNVGLGEEEKEGKATVTVLLENGVGLKEDESDPGKTSVCVPRGVRVWVDEGEALSVNVSVPVGVLWGESEKI